MALPALANFPNLLHAKGFPIAALYTLFACALVAAPGLVLRPKLYAMLSIPLLALLPFVLIHVIEYDGYPTLSGIASAAETNPEEASGFF